MKKYLLSLAAFAALFSLASCDESNIGGNSSNTLTFDLEQTDVEATRTRAELSMPLSVEEFSEDVTLTETVSSLDAVCEAEGVTRGTPAYTENVKDLYQYFNGLAYSGTSVYLDDARFDLSNTGGKLVGSHRYPDGVRWPEGSLQFFLRMPVTECNALNPTYNTTTGAISFSGYTQPEAATSQKDLLFTSKTITETGTDRTLLFYHPFTGVKFSLTSTLGDHVVGITKVEVSGLTKQGNCVITPAAGQKSAACVAWSSLTGTTTVKSEFTATESKGQDLSTAQGFPASFNAADVNKKALNDASFSKTLFLIPQTVDDNVKVTITIQLDASTGNKVITRTLDFGKLLKAANNNTAVVWKPGELRTYTFGVANETDITVVETFDKTTKKDVKIENLKNGDVYVRAIISANWVKDGKIVAPYTEGQGTYSGLPGTNWVKNGAYYYYTKVLPGYQKTTNLFTSFTYPDNVPLCVKGAHLEMTVAAQAVPATGKSSYTVAWNL